MQNYWCLYLFLKCIHLFTSAWSALGYGCVPLSQGIWRSEVKLQELVLQCVLRNKLGSWGLVTSDFTLWAISKCWFVVLVCLFCILRIELTPHKTSNPTSTYAITSLRAWDLYARPLPRLQYDLYITYSVTTETDFTCSYSIHIQWPRIRHVQFTGNDSSKQMIFRCKVAAKGSPAFPQFWLLHDRRTLYQWLRNKLFSIQVIPLMFRSLASWELWQSKLCCVTVITMTNFPMLNIRE